MVAGEPAKLLLGPDPARDVDPGPGHPERPPLRIADDEAAIGHRRVASIPAPEPVLLRPGRSAAVDGGMDSADHPVDVLGPDPLPPPGRVGPDVGRLETEVGAQPIAVPDPVGVEVPVPDRVVRGEADEAEALLARRQRPFDPLAPGDVADDRREQRACRGRNDGRRHLDVDHDSVASAVATLSDDPALVAEAGLDVPGDRLGVVIDEVDDRQARQVGGRGADHFSEGPVRLDHPQRRRVEKEDPVAELIDDAKPAGLGVHRQRLRLDGTGRFLPAPRGARKASPLRGLCGFRGHFGLCGWSLLRRPPATGGRNPALLRRHRPLDITSRPPGSNGRRRSARRLPAQPSPS